MNNFRSSTAKMYWINTTNLTLNSFTSSLICVKCGGEGGRSNHFKFFENHKSYVDERLHR